MKQLRAFALFWWDFIVGDDYRVAVGVILVLGVCAVLVRRGTPVWWLVPVGVVCLLVASVADSARHARGRS